MDNKLPSVVEEGAVGQHQVDVQGSPAAVVEGQASNADDKSSAGPEGELLSVEPVEGAPETDAMAVGGAEGINLSPEPVPDVNIPVPAPPLPAELDARVGDEAVKDDNLRGALGEVSEALGGDLSSAQRLDAAMAQARKLDEPDQVQ
jgi:hypothetical protein